MFFLLCAVTSLIVFYFFHKGLRLRSNKGVEDLKEKINILSSAIDKKSEIIKYLPLKQKKASSLVDLSRELVELDDPDDVFDFLLSAVEQLFPGFSFVSFFEFDQKTHRLMLIHSLKEKDVIIKEKQGGSIEKWMLRQNSSLLIGDIRKDFRFDANQVDGFLQRQSLSFLASPLSVGDDFFGIIRIESKKENFFSHEDLRFLSNICDLGAVVLERAKLIKRVEELAVTDSLTLLSLRKYFIDKLDVEIKRARENKSKLGLIMLDIDDFKKINDLHGHVVGDLVLKKIARTLRQLELDLKTMACRYGGEEFMVSVFDTSVEEVIRIAQDLREKISKLTVAYRRNKVNFTISVGLALYPDNASGVDDLLESADKLMYKAKREGKNKVCYLS